MDTHFDVLVLGTGLTQSITAAALAKAGFKVAHIDQNAYYGADQASLSHDELLQWSQSVPSSRFTSISASPLPPLPSSRSYSLSLAPALIPSAGSLIAALILSGVSRYGQFKLLDAVYVYRHDALNRVPGNKEDVFKSRDVSLVDKRKLMRFLQFAGGEFEVKAELEGQRARPLGDFMRDKFALSDDASQAILYALAYCSSPSDPTFPALVRLRQYLRSAGRYGNSPFLVGHYGGLGELAQGFCRTCAVNGGTYILGRKIVSLRLPSDSESGSRSEAARASIELEDVADILTADFVITSTDYLPGSLSGLETAHETPYACCIAITDRPLSASIHRPLSTEPTETAASLKASEDSSESSQPDTAVVAFPPGSLPEGKAPNAVRVLQMGEGTLSCPRGKYVLYLWTRVEKPATVPEELLRPYLSVLTTSRKQDGHEINHVEFSLFYMRSESDGPHGAQHPRTLIVSSLRSDWPEIADQAAQDAESLFWDTVKELGRGEDNGIKAFWPPLETVDEEDDGEDW